MFKTASNKLEKNMFHNTFIDLSQFSGRKETNHRRQKRGCVKMLAQPFFMRKARTFPSPGF
ncbi:hypothetical protein M1B78_18430, partial [Bacteroides sp. KH569_7]